jgi:hypothetical protein
MPHCFSVTAAIKKIEPHISKYPQGEQRDFLLLANRSYIKLRLQIQIAINVGVFNYHLCNNRKGFVVLASKIGIIIKSRDLIGLGVRTK